MITLLMSFAAAGMQAPAAQPERTLQTLPGVTVNYYDVTGKSEAAIRKSIARQRPKGPNGEPVAGGTSWQVGADITKRTENDTCTVVGAKTTFSGTAELPRHTSPQVLPPNILESWNSYVAGLESAAAANLWFVHDRLGQIEQALIGTPCDEAGATMQAASERLKAEEQAFREQLAAEAAKTGDRAVNRGLEVGTYD